MTYNKRFNKKSIKKRFSKKTKKKYTRRIKRGGFNNNNQNKKKKSHEGGHSDYKQFFEEFRMRMEEDDKFLIRKCNPNYILHEDTETEINNIFDTQKEEFKKVFVKMITFCQDNKKNSLKNSKNSKNSKPNE